MNNVDFRKMDLLGVADLDETFDTIECSGVLHHMEDPAKGLSALRKQLKPGGYIKLGLYSDIARQEIVKVRKQIKQLGLKSTADRIRKFRKQVENSKIWQICPALALIFIHSLNAEIFAFTSKSIDLRQLCYKSF